MGQALDKLTIKGFKSIELLENFELSNLNILIGGNGAGKSNFVEIFRMLSAMVNENFANYIMNHGGADDFMFNGPKVTKYIEAEFLFGRNAYRFKLEPSATEKFIITDEGERYLDNSWKTIGTGNRESQITANKDERSRVSGYPGVGHYIHDAISNWVVYHFHDTSATASMRRYEITADNRRLRSDAANIAPFLLELKHDEVNTYKEIIESVKIVTPFFDDFILKPIHQGKKDVVNLSWKQKGSDYPMQPYHFSDGTIRFICLATALLQPYPPTTIVIDEPELGLHPYAIEILAELIEAASNKTQVIVSTQSPHLIDHFNPENIIVVNREKGSSTFKRLKKTELTEWLKDYSLGDLWRKNIIMGGPVNE
ncbi:MAG TPA: AAA family ATPase [Anaerohalosphaeraceae bacterium]|nr:AAA family ATPase [Anaerohalosphaeraceae bacterium]